MNFENIIIGDMATASGATDALRGRPQPCSGQYAMWSAKYVSTIATVNVRTLNGPGKLNCVLHEMNRYRWDVLGLAETHWIGQEELISEGVKVLSSGRDDGIHREGVALLLNKKAQKSYIEHRTVSSRIISVTLKGHHKNAKIIQVYAPDSSHDDEEVEDFYQSLSDEMERTKPKDLLYIIGDFNSRVGSNRDGYSEIIGGFGIGERNDRGDRLLDFCAEKGLRIMNTYFRHAKRHKLTWNHPNGVHRSCIDYVLTKKRWSTAVQDVIVRRGADFGSDHELILANVKIKFKAERKQARGGIRLNTEKLESDSVKKTLQRKIQERFSLISENTSLNQEERWNTGKEALMQTAEEILGKKRPTRQPWMTDQVLNACDKRRDAKRKKNNSPTDENKEEYRVACRKVKRECQRAKERWIEDKCLDCESHFRRGSSRPLFRTVRELSKAKRMNGIQIKNDQGEAVTDERGISLAWKEYFEKVYEHHDEEFRIEDHPQLRSETDGDNAPLIIESEVQKSVNEMSTNKAPGRDGLPVEILKAGGHPVETWLTKLYNEALQMGNLPRDWTSAEIVPIFKKGDPTDRSNYRPISLLSHSYKVLAKILQKRIESKEETILTEEQAGFRTGRGTADQIFSFSQIIEKTWENDKDVFCLFIDFEKAFDSVWRPAMEATLHVYGFDENIIGLIKNINSQSRATVRRGKIITSEFTTNKGVLQGCPLSPHLFNIFLEYVMRVSLENHSEDGINIGGQRINNLRYADDIVIVAETEEQLQSIANSVHTTCTKYKLKINARKTKSMVFSRRQPTLNITVGNTSIEQVDGFRYLGTLFCSNRDSLKPIKERISIGYAALGRLSKLWRDRHISLRLKFRLLNTIVIPAAIYGSESWILKQTEKNKLCAFEMNCLRRVLNIRWHDRITNVAVRNMARGWKSIVERVEDQQRRWFGHVMRMPETRWPKMLLHGRVHGSRPRGRPRISWWKQFRSSNNRLPTDQLLHLTQDRHQWRNYRKSMRDPT